MHARRNQVWIRPEGSLRTRQMESAYDIAYDNPAMKWNLSGKETLGVVAVGAALAFIANKVRGDEGTGTPLLTGARAARGAPVSCYHQLLLPAAGNV